MPAVADVVRELGQANCPVIFLDTCVLLDIIRSVERRLKNCAAAANTLFLASTKSPADLRLVVSHIVHHEWRVNAPQRLTDAERHLQAMQEQSGYFHDSCELFGVSPGFVRSAYATHDIPTRLHELSHRLLDIALVIDSDDECAGRAIRRVTLDIPPSKKGG